MIADIPEKSATTLRIYEQIERKANIFLLFRDAAVNAHVVGITKVYPNSKIFARFPIKS